MIKKINLLKAVAVVTIYSVITRFLSFLFKIYLSRSLGAEVVGLYQICLSVFFLMVAFSASGLPLVLSRKIAEDLANGGRRANKYLTATLVMSVGISSFIVLIFFIFKNNLTFIFADKRAMPLFLIMLPALFSTCIYTSVRGWFWGHRDYNAFSLAELIEEVFRIAFSVLLAGGLLGWITGAKAIALAFTISDFACAAVLIMLFLKRKGRFERPSNYIELLRPSVPITAMRIFGGLIASLTALVVPAMLVKNGMPSSIATATFGRVAGMAMPLLMAPTTLTGALAIVLIPEIATASTKNDLSYLQSRIDGSLLFSLFISSLFCVLYIPFGREVGEIVFNDTIAGDFLANSAILLFPIGLNQISLSMLNSLGLEKKSFKNYIVGTVLLLTCIFILPKYIGVYAIAVGSGVCFTISAALNIKMLSTRIPLFENLKKPILTICFMPLCCLLAYLLKWLIAPVLSSVWTVLIAGGIPMIIYFALAVVFEIIKLDRFYFKIKPQKKAIKPL
ncbi:MAG: oligosaccharide flippase family protein [Clostridia bacterium]